MDQHDMWNLNIFSRNTKDSFFSFALAKNALSRSDCRIHKSVIFQEQFGSQRGFLDSDID